MNSASASDDEMRRHSRNPVPPLDPTMVERILDGAVPEEDVPPDYRDVLRVLTAAAAPVPPVPSAEAAALAAFRSTRPPVDPRRRKSVLSKLLGAKAIVAIAIGTASVGTAAAAATGTLPDSAQAKAHSVVSALPDSGRAGQAGSEAGAEAASHAGSASAGGAADHQSLPGAVGLCQAYASGQGGENGGRLDGAGFQRLSDAAGGADKITAYCATVTAASPAAAASAAAEEHDALVGLCRSWLAADRAGRTLAKATLDRLTAAAGGSASIATYCTELVGPAPADPRPSTPAPPVSSPGDSHGDPSTPSHPAPATPRG